MDPQVTFGEWIRRRRKTLDLTQAQLADRVAYSTISVRRVEAGTRRPSRQMLDLLADALDVPPQQRVAFHQLGRVQVGPMAGPPTDVADVISWTRRVVPHPLSDMVGRAEEERHVLELLHQGARLVTLSGPAGVGKTRLATSVAHQCTDLFDDVGWVPLAGTTDSALVLPEVTATLGLGSRDGTPPQESANRLGGRRSLVVLDSMEHLTGAAPALAELLEALPTMSVVVTSQVPLLVPGEVTVPLHPFARPAAGTEPAALVSFPAAQLFCAAAQRVQPDFAVTAATATPVAALCRELDGLPLALEIAAGNLRMLSVQDLARRIAAGGWPEPQSGRADRHRSLQTAIESSLRLLSPPTRALLAQLSVFADGWGVEAAEAMCVELPGVSPGAAVSMLGELAEHSLLAVRPETNATSYAMLNTVRRYCQDSLREAGGAADAERRHLDHYAALSGEACRLLVSAHQVQCLELVTNDLDNVRLAIDRALEAAGAGAGDVEAARAALVMAAGLERFWSTTGRSAEGVRRLRAGLAAPISASGELIQERVEALGALSLLEAAQHRFEQAREVLAHMRGLGSTLDDPLPHCVGLRNAGTIAVLEGSVAEGERLLAACLDAAGHTAGSAHVAAWARTVLGTAAYLRGDLDVAHDRYADAIVALRALGDLNFLAVALRRQAQIALARERLTEARPLLHESLQHNVSLRSPAGIASCLATLADLRRREGEHDDAALGLGRAGSLLDRSGDPLAGPDETYRRRCADALRESMGEDRWRRLLDEGADRPCEREWLDRVD